MMNRIFQGHIATDGSTKITCTGTSLVVNTIIINNINSDYVLQASRFTNGPGIHEVPIYTFELDQGDTIRDTEIYFLETNDYIQLISDVEGTTYYIVANDSDVENIVFDRGILTVLDKNGATKNIASGGGSYINGSGLDLVGNEFSIASLGVINYMINDVEWIKVTGAPDFLIQEEVEEYLNFAALPITGTIGVIYVVTNADTTGIPAYYIWNGATYVTTTIPVTGITGSGLGNYLPKFTSPTTLGNSRFFDDGTNGGGKFTNGSQTITFIPGGNVLNLARSQSNMLFTLGVVNALSTTIYSSQNKEGLEIVSEGDLTLKAGVGAIGNLRLNRTTGNVSIGAGTTPSAVLHLKAGTATASSAPLKFTAGVNLTTPEDGAIEFDGTNLYITIGGVRKQFVLI